MAPITTATPTVTITDVTAEQYLDKQEEQTFVSNITYTHGLVDAFSIQQEGDAVIVPVNCIGIMGAGMAEAAKRLRPRFAQKYIARSKASQIIPGRVLYNTDDCAGQTVIAFPTKLVPQFASTQEIVEMSLVKLVETYASRKTEIKRLIFPKVGCGKGGLDWKAVGPLLAARLGALNIPVVICIGEKDKEYHLDEQGNIIVLEAPTAIQHDDVV